MAVRRTKSHLMKFLSTCRLFLSGFRLNRRSFERFGRTIGYFVVFYMTSMAAFAVLFAVAGIGSVALMIALLPFCMFLAYRVAHSLNRVNISKEKEDAGRCPNKTQRTRRRP